MSTWINILLPFLGKNVKTNIDNDSWIKIDVCADGRMLFSLALPPLSGSPSQQNSVWPLGWRKERCRFNNYSVISTKTAAHTQRCPLITNYMDTHTCTHTCYTTPRPFLTSFLSHPAFSLTVINSHCLFKVIHTQTLTHTFIHGYGSLWQPLHWHPSPQSQ